jgi:hypothetical protein
MVVALWLLEVVAWQGAWGSVHYCVAGLWQGRA